MNTLPRKCIVSVLSCYFFVSTSKACIFIFVVKLSFASIYGELLLLERFKTVTNLHNLYTVKLKFITCSRNPPETNWQYREVSKCYCQSIFITVNHDES